MDLSAEIIAIGSELLTPQFKDINSFYLTEELNAIGSPVVMKTVAGDDEHYLEAAVRGSLERTPILITMGGLGPTEDDVTRKVIARVLQRQLVLNDEILAKLQRRFKARGVEMPANNARQALVLTGSDILENNHGTAPGLWVAAGIRRSDRSRTGRVHLRSYRTIAGRNRRVVSGDEERNNCHRRILHGGPHRGTTDECPGQFAILPLRHHLLQQRIQNGARRYSSSIARDARRRQSRGGAGPC